MTKNLVFNKQIVLAVGMIVFIVAAVIGATGAFFSDTESSTGNVFTAGAVDIAITDITHTPSEPNLVGFTENSNGLSFSFSDLKPLDKGTVTYTLNNTDNEAFVCAMVKETGNHDNGTNGPEIAAGDTTGGAGEGELGQFLNFKFGTESGSLSAISGVWQTVGTIASPGTLPAAIDYCFGAFSGNDCVLGAGNYNLAQTDSLTADVEFYAVQTRNNEGFDCSSLNPVPPVPQWTDAGTVSGGAVDFVEDDGETVLRLTTTETNPSRVRWTNMNLDLDVADVIAISFGSNVLAGLNPAVSNATMRLFIDLDGDVSTVGDVQEVTYEPYYNIAAHNSNGPAAIVQNTWQTWTTTLAEGKFWANGGFLGSTPNGGGYPTNFTLAQVLAAHANAKIVGISLGMGTWNPSQVVLVSDLVINGVELSLEN
jgi:predicted ribosomally synthesized peptide with SipW-like signal peptide